MPYQQCLKYIVLNPQRDAGAFRGVRVSPVHYVRTYIFKQFSSCLALRACCQDCVVDLNALWQICQFFINFILQVMLKLSFSTYKQRDHFLSGISMVQMQNTSQSFPSKSCLVHLLLQIDDFHLSLLFMDCSQET